MTLRFRIILVYILLTAGSFSLITWMIVSEVRPRYLEAVEESTVDIAELLAALLAQEIRGNTVQVENVQAAMAFLSTRALTAKIYDLNKQKVTLTVTITDDKGILLYDSSGMVPPGTNNSRWRDVYLTLKGKYGARSTRLTPNDPSSSAIYVAAPIIKDGVIRGVVSVGKPKDSVSFFISIAKRKILLSFGIISTTAALLLAMLSIWITRPVTKLIEYMHSIRKGTPQRLPAFQSPEMDALGAALTEMQTQLEGKNYIEDYVRALTHEMKSPLTGIKGAGEILRDHVSDEAGKKFLNNIESDVTRLHSLVERMLQLSRLENVRVITKNHIAAEPFFTSLANSFFTQLSQKNIHLAMSIPPELTLECDNLLLSQAISNLISNAIDFSPQGSSIELSLTSTPPTISIRDYGTGIPDFAISKVFNKFFSLNRPDTGKKSSGLGLPFVKEVVALHNGTIQITNTHPGLCVRITLPQNSVK